MYEEYWGLKEKPFMNTPDPRFLYLTGEHEEALTRLSYGVLEGLGACMLTGVFGCGKTMISQVLIDTLEKRGNYKIAFITNPALSHVELLRDIAYRLGADNLPQKKSEVLTDFILQQIEQILNNNISDGKNTVLIIDEAHVIEDRMILEELRLLLNFQLKDRFLLTMILSGQPELKKTVDNIKQLAQRIAIRCHLDKLSFEDTKNYIEHRLNVAGRSQQIFEEDAIKAIYERSGGIPRRINHICDMSLFVGFGNKIKSIKRFIVEEVAKDLEA